jgi:ribose transport system permease protein
LGTMTIIRGLAYIFTGGLPVFGFSPGFSVIGQNYILGIPIPVIILALIFILAWIFLNKTYIGRYFYAIGGNEEATYLSGVNVNKIKYLVYILCTALSAVAGIILASRMNSGQPSVGSGFELDVITAVVLGGVSFLGGEGKLSGMMIGVLIMGVLSNGLILLNVDAYYQLVIKGFVLLAAVGFDRLTKDIRNSI